MTGAIDWGALGLGLAAGALGGVLFFGGLALGIRLALGHRHAAALLIASAALRIALLSGVAALVAAAGASALVGFAAAFVATRRVAVAAAHPRRATGTRRWS